MLVLCYECVSASQAQLVSLFDARLHPFFFIGTYACSVVMAPVNWALGELCHGDQVLWERVALFYGGAVLFNIAGIAAFWCLGRCTQHGREVLAAKDEHLVQEYRRITAGQSAFEEADGHGGNPDEVKVEGDRERCGSGYSLAITDSGKSFYSTSSMEFSRLQGGQLEPEVGASVWGRCRWAGLAMVLTLLVNIVVCSQYMRVPVKGQESSPAFPCPLAPNRRPSDLSNGMPQIPSLQTWLYYSFYVAQCLGSLLAMVCG